MLVAWQHWIKDININKDKYIHIKSFKSYSFLIYIRDIILFVFGGRMNSIKKGKLLVILTVAIIAFGTSTVVASFTNGDVILNMLNITNNGTTELIAVGDGNFTPLTANKVVIQVQNNTTNVTNVTNVTKNNDTNITRDVTYNTQVKNTVSN